MMLLAQLTLATALASAGTPLDPALARGWERVRSADYAGALTTLEPIVRRLSLTPGKERELASVHLALGVACLLGLEQEKAARGHFREALRRDPEATVSGVRQPARVTALIDDVRVQLQERRRSAAVESAWADTSRIAEDTSVSEAARIAALRRFLGQFTGPNPHRPAAEQRLAHFESLVRRRLGTPPDVLKPGRLPKATYVHGTLANLKPGTKGRLLSSDPERLVFLVERNVFVPIGYAYLLSVAADAAERQLTLTFDDLDARRQTLVLELDGADWRTITAVLSARPGINIQPASATGPATR
jgi:hypothetical protein